MKKKISSAPFAGTKQQEDELNAVIQEHRSESGALMAVMQAAQEIYGYVPLEVQSMIAKGLNLPIQEVYGVSTFYAQFTLTPRGRYNISVCLGTACYVKNAQPIIERISQILGIDPEECTEDGKFSLVACRCIGACGLAPVLTVNEEVFGRLQVKDVDKIIKQFQEKD